MSDAVEKHTARDLATYRFSYVDCHLAVCDERTFESLHEYSTSIPTGVADGKVWKRDNWACRPKDSRCPEDERWSLGEYVDCDERDERTGDALVQIWWRKLIVMGDIGDPVKEVTFEPIPESEPVTEPVPEPVKEPAPV